MHIHEEAKATLTAFYGTQGRGEPLGSQTCAIFIVCLET